jgi:paired amphipathic helix protein Sin3a
LQCFIYFLCTDLLTCKRLGVSYCALPKAPDEAPTEEEEVLNDVWASFPTCSQASTTFLPSPKTKFEEFLNHCEDERFEVKIKTYLFISLINKNIFQFDVIIESNAETIKTLEKVSRRMYRMNTKQLSTFTLDDGLGGMSQVLHQRSIRRLYGDVAPRIIEGLKKRPYAIIPIVLRRLKMKEDEWRDVQRDFNNLMRAQVLRLYLDHQGNTFKERDLRMITSKALINEIEDIHHEVCFSLESFSDII